MREIVIGRLSGAVLAYVCEWYWYADGFFHANQFLVF